LKRKCNIRLHKESIMNDEIGMFMILAAKNANAMKRCHNETPQNARIPNPNTNQTERNARHAENTPNVTHDTHDTHINHIIYKTYITRDSSNS
jgi:hypothetical protein